MSRKAQMASAVHSITFRVALSIQMSLPHMPPALLSIDGSFHGILQAKVQDLCVHLGSGTTSTMSRSLGLIVRTIQQAHDSAVRIPFTLRYMCNFTHNGLA